MPLRFGPFAFAAAIRSLFRQTGAAPARSVPPAPQPAEQRKRLFALVQTRPHVVVLAVSDSQPDLESEMRELNETWNQPDLRTERHRYEIQSVCLLQTARDPVIGTQPAAGPREMRGI